MTGPTETMDAASHNQRSFWALAAALLAVSFLLYWPDVRMGFVLDDHYTVAQNPLVKNPSLLPKIIIADFFGAAHQKPESGLTYYRPAVLASFALEYRLFGLNTFGFRLTNILLHVINGLLVYAFLTLLFKKREAAGLAAVMFCILPVHEWVVRYITGRGDLLQVLFSLISLVYLVRYIDLKKNGLLAVSLVFFALSLLSREVAVLNVFLVLLVCYYRGLDLPRTVKLAVPFIVTGGLYSLLRQQLFPVEVPDLSAIGARSLATALDAPLHLIIPALIKAAVPGPFVAVILAAAAVLFVSIVVTVPKGKRGPLFFGLWWVLIGVLQLLVTLNMLGRLGPVLAEHFMYLPGIGFALLLALVFENIPRAAARVLIIAVSAYFLAVGFMSGQFWRSEEKLMYYVHLLEGRKDTVAYEQIVMRFTDDEKAVQDLIARSVSPSKRSVWLRRLGNIYHRRGELPRAVAALNEAVAAYPRNVEALNELAVVHWTSGQMGPGFAAIQQALLIDPNNADAYRLLGTTYYRMGSFAQAAEALERSLANDPDNLQARELYQDARSRLSQPRH